MSKWIKDEKNDQFFVKGSNGKWLENHSGQIVAEFDEISRNDEKTGPIVTLKKQDGWIVRLSPNGLNMGPDENSLYDFIAGKWVVEEATQIPKIENFPTTTMFFTQSTATNQAEIESPRDLFKRPEIIIGFSVFSVLFIILVLLLVLLAVKKRKHRASMSKQRRRQLRPIYKAINRNVPDESKNPLGIEPYDRNSLTAMMNEESKRLAIE